MVRIWNFLVPGDGEHTLKAKWIGTKKQKLFLDDTELATLEGQLVFRMTSGAILRLHQDVRAKTVFSPAKQAKWTLLVNEQPVEEASLIGQGFRDLRNMPDGSYSIAVGFSSVGVKCSARRKFKFFVDDIAHEVTVAYRDRESVWLICLDGRAVTQERQSLWERNGHVDFEVPVGDGALSTVLSCRFSCTWSFKELKWCYALVVNGVLVPVTWASGRGKLRQAVPPRLSSGVVSYQPPCEEASSEESDSDEDENFQEQNEPLPQGVSYDREAGTFQATIKNPTTGRFVFLGEFANKDEAHQKFLEARSKYAPEAPSLAPIQSQHQ